MSKFSDYFNSTTNRGRANVAKATYASLAVLYLYTRFKRRGKDKPVNADNSNGDERNGFHEVKECPPCKSSKETTSDIKTEDQQDWHEPSSPNTNASNQDKPSSNDQDDFIAAAESFIKSSQAKCESSCSNPSSKNKRDYEETSDTII